MMGDSKRFEAASAFGEMLLHDRSSEVVNKEVDQCRTYFNENRNI
jgi:hypothetical protein